MQRVKINISVFTIYGRLYIYVYIGTSIHRQAYNRPDNFVCLQARKY